MLAVKDSLSLVESDQALEAASRSIVLREVPWESYEALRAPECNNRLRMTYAQGVLEIMSPSGKHAKISYLLGCMVYEWAIHRRIKIDFGGDMTFKRQDLSRGVEPDHCYWIANQAAVCGKDELDLTVDPPPDLALEIEISRSAIPKLPIYQTLGVSEVWRYRQGAIEILTLDASRQYVIGEDSTALPGFPLRMAEDLIEKRHEQSAMEVMLAFREAIAKFPKA